MKTMNERTKEAAAHFKVNLAGDLERVSTPYKYRGPTKLGSGFEHTLPSGYKQFNYRHTVGGVRSRIYAHRMVFFLTRGFLPDFIDHIDLDRGNNHPDNLRPVTKKQNQQNTSSRVGSSSRFLGVSWHKSSERWRSDIFIDGAQSHLGYFQSEAEAASMYNLAALEHFKEYASFNDVRS